MHDFNLLGPAPLGDDTTVIVWSPWYTAYGVLGAISAGVSAYHGYKRNNGSVGWAIAWAALGAMFPIITPAVAIAEGYAQPL